MIYGMCATKHLQTKLRESRRRLAGRWRAVERATPEEREAMATTTDKAAERLCEEAEIIQLTLRCRIPGPRPEGAQDAEVALRQMGEFH